MGVNILNLCGRLLLEISENYDSDRVARWADHFYHNYGSQLEDPLDIFIQNLGSMSFGKEFEMTQGEILEEIIKMLNDYQQKNKG
jgi:hypothetical protein